MKKTITIEIQGSARETVQKLVKAVTDAFAEQIRAYNWLTPQEEEQQAEGAWPEMLDDEAAVLWYALEIKKAQRAYDERMRDLCIAASQAKDSDDFCKIMEGNIDQFTFFGRWLHQAINRGHYPWISVEDLKPDDLGLDWVQVQPMLFPERCWGVPETAEMRDGKWYTIDDTLLEVKESVIVTHWRPLPAPPQKELP